MTAHRLFLLAALAVPAAPQRVEWVALSIVPAPGSPLSPADLELACDGRPVAAPVLRAAAGPISVGIVVQAAPALLDHLAETQAALRRFLLHSRPGDEFFTVNGLEQPVLGTGFTSDLDAVVSSLAIPSLRRKPRLPDALAFALRYLEHSRNRNRALLAIVAVPDSSASPGLLDELVAARIPAHFLSLSSRSEPQSPNGFARLALASGGSYVEAASFERLSTAAASLDVRPQYLLGLNPASQCAPATPHRLALHWAPASPHRGATLRYPPVLPALTVH